MTASWRRFLLLCCVPLVLFFPSAAAAAAERGGGVVVWELEDLTAGMAGLDVGELLTARVKQVLGEKGMQLVQREKLIQALEELKVGSSELADDATRLQVGRMVGAVRMVFGAYMAVGTQMRVDLRLVDVETGKVLKAVQKTTSGDLSSWLDAAGAAAAAL